MKKSRFTESQIMAILKQHQSGVSVPELAREGAQFIARLLSVLIIEIAKSLTLVL